MQKPSLFTNTIHHLAQLLLPLPSSLPFQVHPIALLIDGENIAADLAVHLLAAAGQFGAVTIRRVYGNWTHPSMQSWQTMTSHYNLLPIHYQPPVSGKNATDIKLSIDAMDLCRDGYQRFCVVSSDSDFTPLVQRLGEHGCFVLGIGNINTPSLLQHACSTFLSTDQLLPPSRSKTSSALPVLPTTPPIAMPVVMQRNEPTEKQPTSTAPSQTLSSLHTILRETYLQIANDEGKEWVTLARFGQILRQRDPSFKVKSHGSSTLKALLVQQTDLFDIQKQVGNHLILRLKEQH